MIKRYGWWWAAKQMFIPEHIQVIVTLDMGVGEGDSRHKSRLEEGFFMTPLLEKNSSRTCQHGDQTIFTSLEFTQSLEMKSE